MTNFSRLAQRWDPRSIFVLPIHGSWYIPASVCNAISLNLSEAEIEHEQNDNQSREMSVMEFATPSFGIGISSPVFTRSEKETR